jgi:hypothetical protein
MNEVVKYEAEGFSDLEVKIEEETVWLTQAQMVELFETTKQNVSLHIQNIFKEGELEEKATVKDYLTVRTEGRRQVQRNVSYYSLDVIIAVGYRVNTKRGTHFRQWATKVLREHLLKGYTVKQPVSVEQLNSLKNEIRVIADELLQRQDKADAFMYEEFGRVYEIISEITEQKRQQELKPRKKIGFQLPHESEND